MKRTTKNQLASQSFLENQEMSKRRETTFTKCSVGKHQGL